MIKTLMGFLGAGNMAESIIRGVLRQKIMLPDSVAVADVNEIRLAHMTRTYGVLSCRSNRELAETASLVILAVKPQQAREVMEELRPVWDPERHILLSIAAGLTTEFLEKAAGVPLKVVRVMPNTPAQLLAGASAISEGRQAGEAEFLLARRIFEAVGIVVRVPESLMNAVTAVSGSGPAYVFKLCEMMTAAGVELGLSPEDAGRLAVQTVYGAGRMLAESGKEACELRQQVTSPGGTTEAALRRLADSDFEEMFRQALTAARDRGEALAPVWED